MELFTSGEEHSHVFALTSHGMRLDVNGLVGQLTRVRWLPRPFIALVCAHSIDADAFLELTDDDLERHFFIRDKQMRKRILTLRNLCAIKSDSNDEGSTLLGPPE
jgi:hypothetical protein